MAEELAGLQVQARDSEPQPRDDAPPRWRAPLVPGRLPADRARVPLTGRQQPPGRLRRVIASREQELQRGGTVRPTPIVGVLDGTGRQAWAQTFVPWDDEEADQQFAQHRDFLRSIGHGGTVYLEDQNHHLADDNDAIHGELETVATALRKLLPGLPSWRTTGQLEDIGRYSARDYSRKLDDAIKAAEALHQRATAHMRQVETFSAQRERGGYAVMHDMLDSYPTLVDRLVTLQAPATTRKPRGHWHDLDVDRLDSLLSRVQDRINDCEQVRAVLHARDQLRGSGTPVDTTKYSAFRDRQPPQ